METTDSGVHNHNQPSPATIAGRATKSLQSFQSCLNRAALVHARELSLVENQAARFSLWVANSMVFSKGRASMDYRLREAPDVQDVVIGLLEALGHRVQRCTDLLAAQADRTDPPPSVRDTFAQALEGISNSVQLLFRFSNTVRKASKAVHNRKVDDGFRIRDDEGNDIESHLRQMFANYILDRYPGASDILHERLVSTMLLRRKRILYRKSRYGTVTQPSQQPPLELRRHDVAPAAAVPPEMNAMRAPVTIDFEPNDLNTTPESVVRTATTLSPENFHKASTPSVMSVAKTVPLTQHEEIVFPPAPFAKQLQQYKIWHWEVKDRRRKRDMAFAGFGHGPPTDIYSNWIPYAARYHQDLENSVWERFYQGAESFSCPFCFCTLSSEDTTQEEKWRSHVLGDLDPYVCLFENCGMEHELYSHSHAWLDHIRGHALRWRCSSKSHQEDFIAATKDEYLNHMDLSHKGKFTTSQLAVLGQRNARLIGPLFESCPLCGMVPDLDTGPMEDHVVGHLRKIAIHSLPKFHLDANEVDEPVDPQRQRAPSYYSEPRSRSDIIDDDDDGNAALDVPLIEDAANDAVRPESVEDMEEVPLIAQQTTGSQMRMLQWGFVPGIFTPQMDPDSDTQSIVDREIGSRSDVQSTPAPEQLDFIEDIQSTTAPDILRMDPNCAVCDEPAVQCCDCEATGLTVARATAERKVFSRIQDRVRAWVRGHAEEIMKNKFERPELREFALQTLAKSYRDAENASMDTLPHWTDTYSGNSQPDDDMQQDHPVAEAYRAVLDHLFSLPKLACPDDDHPTMNLAFPPIPLADFKDAYGSDTSSPRSVVADGVYDQVNEQCGIGDSMKDTATPPQGEYYRPGPKRWKQSLVEFGPRKGQPISVPTYSYHGTTELEQDNEERNQEQECGSQSDGREEEATSSNNRQGRNRIYSVD
ncbi:hypothetical protein QBC37DRAFT_405481 [Rhypophila decipiens]|uniref:Uncharacterized protein n=1 Tax=Rhypophila decipiens TaxID=261697 RepID=A0AAN6XX58_9PEZI|nr:hypothetical protein QBC37DRAFT_405481 [Rhypophila decipiens]